MRSSTYFAAFPLWKAFRELSSAGSERLPYKQRVGGSNPSAPTNERRRLRFLKRLFLFSGRVGRCGTGRCGQCGSVWSVRVGPVEVDGAGRGGRCGSRWTVRVEAVGAGRGGRCGSVWSVRAGSGRGGLGRASQCGSVGAERGGGRSPGVPRRASGALLPLSCVRSGCSCASLRASGRTAAVIVLSCARRCGRPGAPLPLSCYRVRAAADSRLRPSSLAACCMLCSFRGSSIFGIARPSLSSTPLTLRALRRPRCGAGR